MNARPSRPAYIVAAVRTPVGKAPRGVFRGTRPDDLLAHCLRKLMQRVPSVDPATLSDVVVGCAMPEAEQGLNVARIAALLAGYPDGVAGMTVNRFCASSLEAVAIAAQRIRLGEADLVVAGGVESMSRIPMMGHRVSYNPRILSGEADIGIAYGMGITAEKVAERWAVSREDQDAFALASHRKAIAAQQRGDFDEEIAAVTVAHHRPDSTDDEIEIELLRVATDQGPRADTNPEALSRLRPVFAAKGSVTAGNASQMSDGAAAVLLASESALAELALEPMVRFDGYRVAGVAPEVMGIGPAVAIPALLNTCGLSNDRIDVFELNEAFAAQCLAVMRELVLDSSRVNPRGGAIALGHPLGATGAIRTTSLVHAMRRDGLKHGVVSMCVGTGMGAAALFSAP